MFNMDDYRAFVSAKSEDGGETRFDIDKVIGAIVIAALLMIFERIVG